MNRRIFAVGDSHSRRCFENHHIIADSRVLTGYNKLDGKTAYNLERHQKKLLKILKPLREKELIFCFGEVTGKGRQDLVFDFAYIGNTCSRVTSVLSWNNHKK